MRHPGQGGGGRHPGRKAAHAHGRVGPAARGAPLAPVLPRGGQPARSPFPGVPAD